MDQGTWAVSNFAAGLATFVAGLAGTVPYMTDWLSDTPQEYRPVVQWFNEAADYARESAASMPPTDPNFADKAIAGFGTSD